MGMGVSTIPSALILSGAGVISICIERQLERKMLTNTTTPSNLLKFIGWISHNASPQWLQNCAPLVNGFSALRAFQ